MFILLSMIAIITYCIGIVLFWKRIKSDDQQNAVAAQAIPVAKAQTSQTPLLQVTLVAVFSHSLLLLQSTALAHSINLSLGNIISLISLSVVIVFLLGCLFERAINLGVLVLPIGLTGAIVGVIFSGNTQIIDNPPTVLWIHLTIALLAFAVLCIAAIQALILYIQEQQLHSANPGTLFPALPSLQTMERLLFRLTMLGVILLTANLVTGMWSSLSLSGKSLQFNHHILLSFLAWLSFVALLAGHKFYGWRGQVAARWTIGAFIILLLAYFGTRLVQTFLLS